METEKKTMEELDAMRAQIAQLKEKIARQGRLNEAHVRKLVRRDMRFVVNYTRVQSFLLIPFGLLLWFACWRWMNVSAWLFVYASLVLIVTGWLDWRNNMVKERAYDGNLVKMAEFLVGMKKRRVRYLLAEVPFVIILVVWAVCEYKASIQGRLGDVPDDSAWYAALIPILFGVLMGGLAGGWIFLKAQRANAAAIAEIEDFLKSAADEASPE